MRKSNEPLLSVEVLDACCGGRMMWFQKEHPKDMSEKAKSNTTSQRCSKVRYDNHGFFRFYVGTKKKRGARVTGIKIEALSIVGQSVMETIARDGGVGSWRLFFQERVLSAVPYIVVVEHRDRVARSMVPAVDLAEIVRKQLVGLKAVEGVDFSVVIL